MKRFLPKAKMRQMTKPIGLMLVLLFSAIGASSVAAADPIWSLGKDDQDYSEFALSRDYASFLKRFAQDPVVAMDGSEPARQWPWIHPGPEDAWAGNRPHAFTLTFDWPTAQEAEVLEVIIDTVAAHYGSPPRLTVDLNGNSQEIQTRATCRNDNVLKNPKEGQPARYRAVFLAEDAKTLGNRLVITNVEGSWLLYDCIRLQPRTAEIRELTVTPKRGVRRGDGEQFFRALEVGFGDGVLADEADLQVTTPLGTTTTHLDPKRDRLGTEAFVPVTRFEQPLEVTVAFRYRGKTIEKTVEIPPEQPWEIHLIHQTHLDIGYTHTQEDVLARQVQNLKDALQYIEETKDYPAEARFRFHPEGMWAVDEFMRTASDEEKEAFLQAARNRDIHLDAMYAQAMTGMYNDEELFELMGRAVRFGKEYGITIDSAMQTDVPGYTWGLVPALAHNGIRYLTMGPNGGHRIGRVYHWADKPFWWESPSGKQRVLCWLSGFGYALWHRSPRGHQIRDERLFQILDQLVQRSYPYNLVMLRYNIEGDNGRPNRALSDCVKAWNDKYAWPKLILSRNSDVMRELERRHGKELPVVRGDYTPYWEDGCASTSEATSLCRVACERILQAQALFAMANPAAFPVDQFDATWTDLIMYDEHTWGAYCSISRPDDPFTIHQDEYKQAYARRGHEGATNLLRESVKEHLKADSTTFDVLNTASWNRSDLVTIDIPSGIDPVSVFDEKGNAVPSQVLSNGKLAFWAADVPAFGARRYQIRPRGEQTTGSALADAQKHKIGNDQVELTIDPASGAIRSLRRTGINADFVHQGHDGNRGLNDFLYILGRDPEENRARPSKDVVVTVVEPGPLVARLKIESPAPNCDTLVRQIEVRHGSDQILLENRMQKRMERQPEGAFFGFPFNVPDGQWHIDIPWTAIRPEKDQLPGANRNFYCVQRWCDLSNDAYGVTWVTLDANMMQFAPIRYTPVRDLDAWRTKIEPTGTLYSWVCNNHWETNYKAGQEGPLTFRYVLRPHAGPYDAADVQRFARGVHQPLIAFPVDAAQPPIKPTLALDNDAVVVTCLKPTRDRRALLVRLFNTTEQTQRVSLELPAGNRCWTSNTLEEKQDEAPESLTFGKYEIVTLRVEHEQ